MGTLVEGATNNSDVFVLGSDGNLWLCQLGSTGGWNWSSLGQFSANQIAGPAGALVEGATNNSDVFVLDKGGNIWLCQQS